MGAPSTKAWRARGGGCPRGLVLAAGGPSPLGRAPIILPRGICVQVLLTLILVWTAELVTFLSLKLATCSWGFGAHRTGLAPNLQKRKKVSNGTDVRSLTPTLRVSC